MLRDVICPACQDCRDLDMCRDPSVGAFGKSLSVVANVLMLLCRVQPGHAVPSLVGLLGSWGAMPRSSSSHPAAHTNVLASLCAWPSCMRRLSRSTPTAPHPSPHSAHPHPHILPPLRRCPLQIQQHDWHCSACGTERDVTAIEGQLCGMLAQVCAGNTWLRVCEPMGLTKCMSG